MPPLPPLLELDPHLPIIMLPVRLETRYFAVDATNVELRVRIFPSSIHVTTDRPGVDPAEHDETVAYWQIRKSAGDASANAAAAWQRMVQLFGDPRARWLRQTLTPSTDAAGALAFPAVTINQPSDAASLASEATALPTRFFVSGYVGERVLFQVTGKDIPASVTAGPHGPPAAIAWQTDFNTAENIGLAVREKLTRQQAGTLTRLLVFGLREGAAAADSQKAFNTLLDRHLRSDGVALLASGTPTNHTPEARVDSLPSASGATPSANSDGARMATTLGMDPASFSAVGATEAASDRAAASMHTALWPVTLGYFLEQVMSPAGTCQRF
jgi:hypothetical protein